VKDKESEGAEEEEEEKKKITKAQRRENTMKEGLDPSAEGTQGKKTKRQSY
jgi:hypothetical protein